MSRALPHWFDDVMGWASLKKVERKSGVTHLAIEVGDLPVAMAVPDGFEECSDLGAALVSIGEILQKPAPLAELEAAAKARKQPSLFPRCDVCRKADATGSASGVAMCDACRALSPGKARIVHAVAEAARALGDLTQKHGVSVSAEVITKEAATPPKTAETTPEPPPNDPKTPKPGDHVSAEQLRRAELTEIPDWVWDELRGTEEAWRSREAPWTFYGISRLPGGVVQPETARALKGPCQQCEGFGFVVDHAAGPEGVDVTRDCPACAKSGSPAQAAPVDDPNGELAYEPSRSLGGSAKRKRGRPKGSKTKRVQAPETPANAPVEGGAP